MGGVADLFPLFSCRDGGAFFVYVSLEGAVPDTDARRFGIDDSNRTPPDAFGLGTIVI